MKKVLFTSVGRRVELVQAFRSAANRLGLPLTIYGADLTTDAPALAFCDISVQVCRIRDNDYIPSLLRFCSDEGIDALIPTIDTDLLLLAEHKGDFERIGTMVVVSEPEMIRICRDKRLTGAFFTSCGLKSPETVDDVNMYSGGFPCFIKPKDGSSSINAFKIDSIDALKERASQVDDYIVQPFIEGTEYTVDIFCDFQGNPLSIIPRVRLAVRSGEVLKTRIVNDQKIIEECEALVRGYKPCGAITVQLIRQNDTGEDYYIEINPRFGGGAPLSMKAGADSSEMLLRLLCDETVCRNSNDFSDGAVYSRFDQSIAVDAGQPYNGQVKAVIFDLDDTLYDEIDYVKSGYSAVAKLIETKCADAEQQLWLEFQNGGNAIDSVLLNNGIFDEDLKKQCLAAYREHTPHISLRKGVTELFAQLRDKGIKIGVLTDGRPEGQRNKMLALGLFDLIDEYIITDELGGIKFRKPNDISFRIMQRRFDLPFEAIAYVGDNLSKDFKAPKTLGMHSLCFDNPNGLYRVTNAKTAGNIKTIYSLDEIFNALNI